MHFVYESWLKINNFGPNSYKKKYLFCLRHCEYYVICIDVFTLLFKCITEFSINSFRYAKDLLQKNFALA